MHKAQYMGLAARPATTCAIIRVGAECVRLNTLRRATMVNVTPH